MSAGLPSGADADPAAADPTGAAPAGRQPTAHPDAPEPEAEEHDPLLDTAVREVVAGVDEAHPYGRPGRPVSERSPYRLALIASFGVGIGYELLRTLFAVRQVLLLAALAFVLAIGLDPPVRWLCQWMRRGFAVFLVVVALLAFFGGFFAAAVPPLTTQVTALVHAAPGYLHRLEAHNATLAHLDARYHLLRGLQQHSRGGQSSFGLSSVGGVNGVIGVGKAVLSAVTATLVVLVLLIYFLASFPALKRGGYRLIPRSRRARVGLITDELLARVGGYILGNFVTSVLAGLAGGVFLVAAGVPDPIALALFLALSDLVPLIGGVIGAAVACVVAFFTSVPVGIAAVVFFVLYQLLDDFVLIPRFLSRRVRISPLVIICAAVIGGTLLGLLGTLLAIPLAAGGQLLLAEVVFPRQQRH